MAMPITQMSVGQVRVTCAGVALLGQPLALAVTVGLVGLIAQL